MKIKNLVANFLYGCYKDPELFGALFAIIAVTILLIGIVIMTKGIFLVLLAATALIIYCLIKFFSWLGRWVKKNKTVEY